MKKSIQQSRETWCGMDLPTGTKDAGEGKIYTYRKTRWAMQKTLVRLGYIGDYTIQLYREYNKPL